MRPIQAKHCLCLLAIFSLLVSQCHAFFNSEILSTVYEIKDRLVGNMSLLEGIQAMTKLNEFIDDTLDEDCVYECRRGKVVMANPDHLPSYNGCGSAQFIFDDSGDSAIYVEEEITKCCKEHDLCYDTCQEDKDYCDLKFKKCLYKVCRNDKFKKYLDNKKCKLKAKVFYLTVVGVGCVAFKQAQSQACTCVTPEQYAKTTKNSGGHSSGGGATRRPKTEL